MGLYYCLIQLVHDVDLSVSTLICVETFTFNYMGSTERWLEKALYIVYSIYIKVWGEAERVELVHYCRIAAVVIPTRTFVQYLPILFLYFHWNY